MLQLCDEDIEQMARTAHDRYLSEHGGVTYDELPEDRREANRDSVAFAPLILAALGLDLVRSEAMPSRPHLELTAEEVEAGARLEHLRWVRFTRRRDRGHPDLVPWEALDEPTRDKDRRRVTDAVGLLAEIGVVVSRTG